MRLVVIILALLFSVSAAKAFPVHVTERLVRRLPPKFVASGGHVILWQVSALNPDCSSNGRVTFRILKKPHHGKLHIARTKIFPGYPPENVRHVCNHRRVAGQRMTYTARAGYVGGDYVKFETIYPSGRAFTVGLLIVVR